MSKISRHQSIIMTCHFASFLDWISLPQPRLMLAAALALMAVASEAMPQRGGYVSADTRQAAVALARAVAADRGYGNGRGFNGNGMNAA